MGRVVYGQSAPFYLTIDARRPARPTPRFHAECSRSPHHFQNLHAEIDDLVVAGDRASVHLHFYGHFTGQFQNLKGNGQPVDFQAFDLYRVKDGRIVENWHLEDNLTLLRQLGASKP
ncbi:ester cyclase [Paraburkholderia xenovorans]|jgi:predicted ester cyclase